MANSKRDLFQKRRLILDTETEALELFGELQECHVVPVQAGPPLRQAVLEDLDVARPDLLTSFRLDLHSLLIAKDVIPESS